MVLKITNMRNDILEDARKGMMGEMDEAIKQVMSYASETYMTMQKFVENDSFSKDKVEALKKEIK